MLDATFARPDLTTFCQLDDLGLEVVGQHLEPDRAVLACRVREPDRWCRRCGGEGVARDSVTRRLAHEPFGWRPTTLLVTVPGYRCADCRHVWRQDLRKAADPRAKLTRGGLRWALAGIVCQHLTVARVAEALGVAWNTANDLAYFDRPGTSNGPTEAIWPARAPRGFQKTLRGEGHPAGWPTRLATRLRPRIRLPGRNCHDPTTYLQHSIEASAVSCHRGVADNDVRY